MDGYALKRHTNTIWTTKAVIWMHV